MVVDWGGARRSIKIKMNSRGKIKDATVGDKLKTFIKQSPNFLELTVHEAQETRYLGGIRSRQSR